MEKNKEIPQSDMTPMSLCYPDEGKSTFDCWLTLSQSIRHGLRVEKAIRFMSIGNLLISQWQVIELDFHKLLFSKGAKEVGRKRQNRNTMITWH